MYRHLLQRTNLCKNISWSRFRFLLQQIYSRQFSESPEPACTDGVDSRSKLDAGVRHSTLVEKIQVPKYEQSAAHPRSRVLDRNAEDLYRRYLLQPDQPEDPHLIRVAIIGAPNAGKSSLVNSLMGWKVNAVSKKVHTTRANTNTVFSIDNTQIIFVDTPGVLTRAERRKHHCDGRMLTDPEKSLEEADLVGVIVDASNLWTRFKLHPEIIKVLHLHQDVKSFLILNKVDHLKTKSVLKQQRILLGVTSRLADGKIGGKEFGRKITERKKEQETKISDNLFDKLEKKYGELDAKKKAEHEKTNKKDSMETQGEAMENTKNSMENGIRSAGSSQNVREEIKDELDKSSNIFGVDDRTMCSNDNKLADNTAGFNKGFSTAKSKQQRDAEARAVADRIFKKLNIVTGESVGQEAVSVKETEIKHEPVSTKQSGVGENFSNKNMNHGKELDNRRNRKEVKEMNAVEAERSARLDDCKHFAKTDGISGKEGGITGKNVEDGTVELSEESRGINILEKSYQSDFLESIQSRLPQPEFSNQSKNVLQEEESKEEFDWTDKVSLINEAAKLKGAWGNFDEVFLTSCIDGTGIDLVREYLVKNAKPRNWIFHSSVVTDQHPYDIAKMCVTQSLLDHLDSYLPYVKEPEIIYWDVDEHNRLNISVELRMNNTYEMNLMLGGGSSRIQAISSSARQALMDAFQCEVRFKMAIVRKKNRS